MEDRIAGRDPSSNFLFSFFSLFCLLVDRFMNHFSVSAACTNLSFLVLSLLCLSLIFEMVADWGINVSQRVKTADRLLTKRVASIAIIAAFSINCALRLIFNSARHAALDSSETSLCDAIAPFRYRSRLSLKYLSAIFRVLFLLVSPYWLMYRRECTFVANNRVPKEKDNKNK